MISQTGVHALRAMIALADLPEGRREGAAEIARRVRAPRNYLGKLLYALGRQGLVTSRKGAGGGFELARAPGTVTLWDVLQPFEDAVRLQGCFLGRPECSSSNPCHVHDAWAPVRDAYAGFLRGTTLADLLQAGGVERLDRFLAAD